jgi:hypothetical protein
MHGEKEKNLREEGLIWKLKRKGTRKVDEEEKGLEERRVMRKIRKKKKLWVGNRNGYFRS